MINVCLAEEEEQEEEQTAKQVGEAHNKQDTNTANCAAESVVKDPQSEASTDEPPAKKIKKATEEEPIMTNTDPTEYDYGSSDSDM